nr:peptide chain release factor N(5)-glutamine methyltransferase [Pseudokineococcus lusitanus]
MSAPADGGAVDPGVLVRRAAARLAAAGIPSPRPDAEALLASVLGVDRAAARLAALRGDALPPGTAAALEVLVDRRAAREPLQHLTGRAPFDGLDLAVGPGVFVPRPETEGLARAAAAAAAAVGRRRGRPPVVVDLCAGSGALALAVAARVPDARVTAVELSPDALAWARRNVRALGAEGGAVPADRPGGPVRLLAGDVTAPLAAVPDLAALVGDVDVVVSNPPYIPPGAVPVDPEVRDHDPALALYGGGDDGLLVPRAVLAVAARLLAPGGVVLVEHAEVQQEALLALLAAGPGAPDAGSWRGATGAADLTGRPRWVQAVRTAAACHDAPS